MTTNDRIAELQRAWTRTGAALSDLQRDCLRLTAAGHDNGQTARRLNVSRATVAYALTQARGQLGAHNTAHACALAVAHGIVTAEHLGLKEDA